ncbi:MAG: NTP transferase domain-containing protein, partial [Actinomycetia bacterium]|nr:NTP transferase domain-containing protein [Actinomycetes bacterium]
MVTDVTTTYEHRYVVVVAGGSGTRLWPASRRELPKQMQAFISDRTLIAETVERLRSGPVPADHIYISTTQNYADRIRQLLPDLPADNIIVEPVPRGTAAAFALFTTMIAARDPSAILLTLASDHAVTGLSEFHETMRRCYEYVESHRDAIALVGIEPTRPDTGLGYIKVSEPLSSDPLIY